MSANLYQENMVRGWNNAKQEFYNPILPLLDDGTGAISATSYKGESSPTATEFSYLANVNSPIQSQLADRLRVDTNAQGLNGTQQANGRTNLGLGSAATMASSAFEPAITAGTSSQYIRGDKTLATLNTSVVPESGNLYYTDARFDTRLASRSTDNLAEGSANLYFSNARARSAISSASANQITYNSTTGAIGTPQNIHSGASPQFAGLTISATPAVAVLNGTGASDYSQIAFQEAGSPASYINNINSTFATVSRRNNLELLNASASGSITFWTNTTPSASIDSSGNFALSRGYFFINTSTANLYLKDVTTGFQSNSSLVVTLQSSNAFRSSNYSSGEP